MADPSIIALPRCTRIAVRAGAAAASIGAAFGVALPDTPCRANTAGDRAALWLGPDEWLLLAPDGAAPMLDAQPASIVDVSHRTVGIAVTGERAADVLSAFCALDLGDVFPPGACTRTLFGKAEIILWRTAPDTFRIEVARSFGPYVQACLAEAALDCLL
jgi:heterotetrameric sarcosine oxidase gamma subunit